MSITKVITNDFLKTYLQYVHNTESPVIMHVWCAIAAASAAMGRHVWLESGIQKTYANHFCLLVGPPGTRKSTAIRLATKLMTKNTGVKIAPDDTGGQRQGLIAAIENLEEEKLRADISNLGLNDITDVDILKINSITLNTKGKEDPDRHSMFINAGEFGSFLGQNSLDLTRFLIKMWDGDDYNYSLKKEKMILKSPLINLLGGITSSDLATLLPPEAIGQGFMSRIILVFAPGKEKSVPPSQVKLDKTVKNKLISIYKYLFYELKGGLKKSQCAFDFEDKIYMSNIKLQDARFIYYSERRADHLTKLAMVLAASKMESTITGEDYKEAHLILQETEKYMSEALGEYGLSPLAVSRQKMVEFLRQSNGPVLATTLWAMMRKDMRQVDFLSCLTDLINANKITSFNTKDGKTLTYVDEISEVMTALSK